MSKDSDDYDFYVTGRVLKIKYGKTALKMGRNMVILSLDCLNG